ncbi:hypothetical protein GCM10009837_43020 [Streptomyces durmitorensis]|uniref:DUF4280 domain-containing protein n=1 Tax=Streptomyces durmitorensis TaxID=319947 RepID=A0ABY4Q5M7_9ACTN|nr:hypothetical protein [Streptomyces durmitorensis]UQT60685.1 hypothetical protein M4V62_39555 [Streptomyces durmitorensis]
MAGFLLHSGATVQCAHTGGAQPTGSSPRVKVAGQAVVTQPTSYSVSPDCKAPRPTTGNGPCVTAQWTSGATRVKSTGLPVLLDGSAATCAPTGTGLSVISTQQRVKGA